MSPAKAAARRALAAIESLSLTAPAASDAGVTAIRGRDNGALIPAAQTIPQQYANFLTASTQASAALIGLLFVSVSIAPERVFGRQAEATRQALAVSSFTALANVFFVSFGSLIPDIPLGPLVMIPGVVATGQNLLLLRLLPQWRREHTMIRGLLLLLVGATIYGYEIAIGVRLWLTPSDTAAMTFLLELLLGAYAIGLARAWELLGASHRRSLFSAAIGWLKARLGMPDNEPAPTLDKPPQRPRG